MARTPQKPAATKDEADILNDLDAEPADPNEPNGPQLVTEDAVKKAGAVDTESIRSNQIANDAVNRKRGGDKNVTINEPLLQKYETLTRFWPVNTLAIFVKRLGDGTEWTITTQPRNGTELYSAIKALHGRRDEATYEVWLRDSNQKQNRGNGRIAMPDTREELPPQPQPGVAPMNPYYQQPPYGAPGYPQQQPQQPYAQPGYAPQPGMQQPQPAPVVQVTPPAFDPSSMMSVMQQMFTLFQQMQQSAQPQQQQQPMQHQQPMMPPPPPAHADPASQLAWMQQMFGFFREMQQAAQPAQPQHAPQQQQQQPMMPPPPNTNDPAAQMAWMQQMFSMFQQMQQQAAQPQQAHGRGSHQQQPQQPAMNPMMTAMGMPPTQAPPGMTWVPLFGWVPTDRLFDAVSGRPTYRGPGPGYRGGPGGYPPSYQGQGNGEYPQDGQQPPPYAPGYGRPQQPPQPKSMADQFREAATVIQMATDIADQFRPPEQAPVAQPQGPEEDDSPVRVIDAGPAKLVINRSDGSARYWETAWANADKMLKWVGEQREAIQKAAADRDAAKQRQLPPGYVEVTPGYQPPPGYVVGPPEQFPPQAPPPPPAPMQPGMLPAPPAQMPPPITQPQQRPVETAPDPRRTWTLPTIP